MITIMGYWCLSDAQRPINIALNLWLRKDRTLGPSFDRTEIYIVVAYITYIYVGYPRLRYTATAAANEAIIRTLDGNTTFQ